MVPYVLYYDTYATVFVLPNEDRDLDFGQTR